MTLFREVRFLEPEAIYGLLVVPLIWICWLIQRWLRDRDRRASGIGSTRVRLSTVAEPICGIRSTLPLRASATQRGSIVGSPSNVAGLPVRLLYTLAGQAGLSLDAGGA